MFVCSVCFLTSTFSKQFGCKRVRPNGAGRGREGGEGREGSLPLSIATRLQAARGRCRAGRAARGFTSHLPPRDVAQWERAGRLIGQSAAAASGTGVA